MNPTKLKQEARTIAQAKGHDLGRFKHTSPNVWEAWCKTCKRTILVDLRPKAVIIHGGAFFIQCKASKFTDDWERSRQLAFFGDTNTAWKVY